jgi:hypothetical protein
VVGYNQKCDARRKLAEQQAASGFTADMGNDRAQLKERADAIPVIEKYLEDLKAYIKDEIRAGRGDFGKKLVHVQMRNAWRSGTKELEIPTVLARRFPELQPFKPRDLRSPADIAKEVGKKAFDEAMSGYVVKSPFGEQIVDVSDKRPSIDAAKVSGFSVITEE